MNQPTIAIRPSDDNDKSCCVFIHELRIKRELYLKHRERSIVRNPALPGRFKKGSKR